MKALYHRFYKGLTLKGNFLLVETESTLHPMLGNLNVMIIEDSFESRGLIKSQLKHFGIKSISSFENGSQLIKAREQLEVDVLLIGFGLGNCHSGIELVQTLTAYKMLPVWCKVIFITNSDLRTSSSYPFRYLKCEVLRKPINPQNLRQLICEGAKSIQLFRNVISNLTNNLLEGLMITLESIPQGELTATQKDELTAITMHLLLRKGEGIKAWNLANSITDEVFRLTNRLAIANALGDQRKLKMTIGMLQGNSAMRKRGLIYELYLHVKEKQFDQAQALIKQQGTHTFSLAEIELYALLTVEAYGLTKAVEFLTFKRGTSLENTFFRNSVRLIKIKCYLYVLLSDPKGVEEQQATVETLIGLIVRTPWTKGSVDFADVIKFARHLLMSLTEATPTETLNAFNKLFPVVDGDDLVALLFMSASAYLTGEPDKAQLLLLKADSAMLNLEVSPEALVNQMWFERVFNTLFAEPDRAREYNRIGIFHAKNDNPYPALNMFYHSHLCARQHSSIAINLLDTLYKLGLKQYWDADQDSLIASIKKLPLRDNEQRKFAAIMKKMLQSQVISSLSPG